MSVSCFEELMEHVGHHVAVVTYCDPVRNVAIECEDCGMVLLDFNREDDEFEGFEIIDPENEEDDYAAYEDYWEESELKVVIDERTKQLGY